MDKSSHLFYTKNGLTVYKCSNKPLNQREVKHKAQLCTHELNRLYRIISLKDLKKYESSSCSCKTLIDKNQFVMVYFMLIDLISI